MPTYEYKCEKCSKVFSVLKPMSESQKIEKCPKCQTIGVRIIGKTGFILKGDGFYANDYPK